MRWCKNGFGRIAMWLYKKVCIRGIVFPEESSVERELQMLHPGERVEYIKTNYYVEKLALCLKIFIVGLSFGILTWVYSVIVAKPEEGNRIPRGEDEDEVCVTVVGDDGDTKREFQVEVYPRMPTEQQVDDSFRLFREQTEEYILGDNPDLQHISHPLKLCEKYEGLWLEVEWESSIPEVIHSDGTITLSEDVARGCLTARLCCGDREETLEIPVATVSYALTEDERIYRDMKEVLEKAEALTREEEYWSLPSEILGREIKWRLKTENYGGKIILITVALTVLSFFLYDLDLHNHLKKRKQNLLKDYPDLLYRLVLYTGAGMSVRSAFLKISDEFANGCPQDKKEHILAGEMAYACRELHSGVSEGVAYEHFGRRTGLQEYIRLSMLLNQNLKKGNSTLLSRLREEADKVLGERLRNSKRLGEEAGTKLLFPMVAMLAVVMIIIMVPAFGSL